MNHRNKNIRNYRDIMTNFPPYIQTFAMTTAFSKVSAISLVMVLFYFRFKFCKGLTSVRQL